MSANFEYVRQHYSVPACIGRRVVANGKPGTIVEDRGHYIGVMLDGERRVGSHHPTWEMPGGWDAENQRMRTAPLNDFQGLADELASILLAEFGERVEENREAA